MISLSARFCCFTNVLAVSPPAAQKPVIVVDPGHGGVDGGAGSGTLLEKNVNLAVSLRLKAFLEQKGAIPSSSRGKTDVSLDKLSESSSSRHLCDLNARVGIINSSGARLFLSIHANSMAGDPSESGSLVFYGKRFRGEQSIGALYPARAQQREGRGAL